MEKLPGPEDACEPTFKFFVTLEKKSRKNCERVGAGLVFRPKHIDLPDELELDGSKINKTTKVGVKS